MMNTSHLSPACLFKLTWSRRLSGSRLYRRDKRGRELVFEMFKDVELWVISNLDKDMGEVYTLAFDAFNNYREPE